MNRKLIAWLLKNDCLVKVMATLRGPDNESLAAKRDGAAILRWTLAIKCGILNPPTDWFLNAVEDRFLAARAKPAHYWTHIRQAVIALRRAAPEEFPSRVPLVAYLDKEAARMAALDILHNARYYLEMMRDDSGAIRLLYERMFAVVGEDLPCLKLSGSRRKRGAK